MLLSFMLSRQWCAIISILSPIENIYQLGEAKAPFTRDDNVSHPSGFIYEDRGYLRPCVIPNDSIIHPPPTRNITHSDVIHANLHPQPGPKSRDGVYFTMP